MYIVYQQTLWCSDGALVVLSGSSNFVPI